MRKWEKGGGKTAKEGNRVRPALRRFEELLQEWLRQFGPEIRLMNCGQRAVLLPERPGDGATIVVVSAISGRTLEAMEPVNAQLAEWLRGLGPALSFEPESRRQRMLPGTGTDKRITETSTFISFVVRIREPGGVSVRRRSQLSERSEMA